MKSPFFQKYLDRFDARGSSDCSCGRRHTLVTRRVLMERGAIAHLAAQIEDRFGDRPRVWILSDENTWEAAGNACRENLDRLPVSETVLPRSPRPATTLDLSERLAREAGAHRPDLVLAVGAGTISDLGKMVSYALSVPNWCVATAPSADAYGSATAATKSAYRARAVPCLPSELLVCDLEILEKAPRNLFLAGLGDLLAKFLAFLDWNVAASVTGEYYCSEAAGLALESARRAIEAAALERSDARSAVGSLIDALITSSFAMQAVGNSRPAATAEHSIGHYWEIAHCAGNPDLELHGLLVGLASRILLPAYRDFYADLPSVTGGAAEIEAWIAAIDDGPWWLQSAEPAVQPYRRWFEEETDLELYSPGTIRAHLERFRERRDAIEELARGIIAELERAVRVLETSGYPFSPVDYGLDLEDTLLPFRYVRGLRSRYSSFNLMHELRREGQALETVRREIESLS